MLCKITLESCSGEPISLLRSHNEALQGFIYHSLYDPAYSAFLHDKGYVHEKRTFKLFAFTDLLERYRVIDEDRRFVEYPARVSWLICTIDKEFFANMLGGISGRRQELLLGHNRVNLVDFKCYPLPTLQKQLVRACSPVCCYSTTVNEQGKKWTHYYAPSEPEFAQLIRHNLLKKYAAYYGTPPADDSFVIEPVGTTKEVSQYYNGFMIKGHRGTFKISGSPELLELAFQVGIGSKNAQGLGLIVPQGLEL